MTKAEAIQGFREVDNSPRGDKIWRRGAWNDYVDYLREAELITPRQRDTWANPF
jgi:hypothetical protein